jgi:hypothetical protein
MLALSRLKAMNKNDMETNMTTLTTRNAVMRLPAKR